MRPRTLDRHGLSEIGQYFSHLLLSLFLAKVLLYFPACCQYYSYRSRYFILSNAHLVNIILAENVLTLVKMSYHCSMPHEIPDIGFFRHVLHKIRNQIAL